MEVLEYIRQRTFEAEPSGAPAATATAAPALPTLAEPPPGLGLTLAAADDAAAAAAVVDNDVADDADDPEDDDEEEDDPTAAPAFSARFLPSSSANLEKSAPRTNQP